MHSLLLLLLAGLPYPAPKLAAPSESMKCDRAVVIAVDRETSQLRTNTAAGLVVYNVAPDAQVIGLEGKPTGVVSDLMPGQKMRVYYTVNFAATDGARVVEIDLE